MMKQSRVRPPFTLGEEAIILVWIRLQFSLQKLASMFLNHAGSYSVGEEISKTISWRSQPLTQPRHASVMPVSLLAFLAWLFPGLDSRGSHLKGSKRSSSCSHRWLAAITVQYAWHIKLHCFTEPMVWWAIGNTISIQDHALGPDTLTTGPWPHQPMYGSRKMSWGRW